MRVLKKDSHNTFLSIWGEKPHLFVFHIANNNSKILILYFFILKNYVGFQYQTWQAVCPHQEELRYTGSGSA